MLLSPISDDPGFEMFAHVTVVSCTIVHGPDVRAAPRVAIQLAREFSIVTPGTKTLIHPLTSLAFTTPAVDTFRSPETLDNTVPTGTPVHDASGYAGNGHVVNEPVCATPDDDGATAAAALPAAVGGRTDVGLVGVPEDGVDFVDPVGVLADDASARAAGRNLPR
jgi:hypothetical protein